MCNFIQLENLPPEANLPPNIREKILPYLFEAGLDTNNVQANRKHTIQAMMVYFIIDKRKRELDDIAKGCILY